MKIFCLYKKYICGEKTLFARKVEERIRSLLLHLSLLQEKSFKDKRWRVWFLTTQKPYLSIKAPTVFKIFSAIGSPPSTSGNSPVLGQFTQARKMKKTMVSFQAFLSFLPCSPCAPKFPFPFPFSRLPGRLISDHELVERVTWTHINRRILIC